jgi:hypothetical protein
MAPTTNTLCSLFRGTTVTQFGDIIDNPVAPYMEHVPATLIEKADIVLDPATQTPMTIRSSVLLLPPWTGAMNSDQVLDEATGDYYMIEEIVNPPTTIGAPVDLRLMLRRITATGI